MKNLALVFLGLVSTGALAQAYECRTPSGNIVLQYGVPCAPGMENRDSGREAARRKEEQRQAEKVQAASELEAAVLRREIRIGMTSEQVLRSWGNPTRQDTTDMANRKLLSWYWPCANRSLGSNAVMFENGVVSAVRMSCT